MKLNKQNSRGQAASVASSQVLGTTGKSTQYRNANASQERSYENTMTGILDSKNNLPPAARRKPQGQIGNG